MATKPSSLTQRSSSGRHVAGSTPGDCGSIAAPMKWSGKRSTTRAIRSLQIVDHAELVSKPPMWCAMKLARGEKIVRSMPRSRIFCNWLDSIDARISSSLIDSDDASGGGVPSARLAICCSRQRSSALGAVV